MKTSKLLSVLFLSQALFFASCKQCYECEKYEHCADLTLDCNGIPQTLFECEASPAELQQRIAFIEATYNCDVTYVNRDPQLLPGNQQEICDTKKEAKDAADDLEVQGYLCVEE